MTLQSHTTTLNPRDSRQPSGPADARGWLVERSAVEMSRGTVLLHAPSHVFQAPGGGENQLVQTGRHLEALGLPVKPFNPWADSVAGARLIHLFGMSREGLELARVAKARGVPVVLSPICWYEPRAILALAGSAHAAACDLAKWAAQSILPRWPRWRRELLATADAVLPNSRAEAAQLVRLFAVNPERLRVVPNGVEPRFARATARAWHERFGPDGFVLEPASVFRQRFPTANP